MATFSPPRCIRFCTRSTRPAAGATTVVPTGATKSVPICPLYVSEPPRKSRTRVVRTSYPALRSAASWLNRLRIGSRRSRGVHPSHVAGPSSGRKIRSEERSARARGRCSSPLSARTHCRTPAPSGFNPTASSGPIRFAIARLTTHLISMWHSVSRCESCRRDDDASIDRLLVSRRL